MKEKSLESYQLDAEGVKLDVDILEKKEEFVRIYNLNYPSYGVGTLALMHSLRASLITDAAIKTEKMMDARFITKLKEQFAERGHKILQKEMPQLSEAERGEIIAILVHEMLGLGQIEFLLNDKNLEEIVVNSAKEPIWVYHKSYGWLKTNIFIKSEEEVQNYASIIARRVGKQITILNPLLDAHLITGDRANATLFPISGRGNTITIRRFKREPWTVTDFIKNKTTNAPAMALIWLVMQYELNFILSGGTASGKTSFMNICMPFIQPNHRILSIEDTRELQLPDFLHWVPLTTREPNPEGKGGVSMLDLLINSLRMRPDRLIVGETRRKKEAEVLFEGMHTGHSAYTTFHANTAEETIRRLTNPPIEVPTAMMDAVHLNIVMFRNRRLGVRRVLQIAEYIPERRGDIETVKANILFRWKPAMDEIGKHAESIRLYDELSLHTGMAIDEINKDLVQKEMILNWMVKQNIRKINEVGKVFAEYYMDADPITELAKKNKPFKVE